MKVQSEKLQYWDLLVEAGEEKAEDTQIMKSFWDENEDSLFLFVMSLMV